MKGIKKFIN